MRNFFGIDLESLHAGDRLSPESSGALRTTVLSGKLPEGWKLVSADLLAGDVAPPESAGLAAGIVLGIGEVDAGDVYPPEEIITPHKVLAAVYIPPTK